MIMTMVMNVTSDDDGGDDGDDADGGDVGGEEAVDGDDDGGDFSPRRFTTSIVITPLSFLSVDVRLKQAEPIRPSTSCSCVSLANVCVALLMLDRTRRQNLTRLLCRMHCLLSGSMAR